MKRSIRFLAHAALIVPGALSAQRIERQIDFSREPRHHVGFDFTYGQPVGDFRDFVKQGFGIGGNYRYAFDREGIFSLRADVGWLQYGRETIRVPLLGRTERLMVDVTTSNNIIYLGLGPQVTLPTPFVRPFAAVHGGFAYFFTESSVEGTDGDDEPFAKTTNFDDVTWSWTGEGGLEFPVRTRRSRTDVSVILSAKFHSNGRVDYLREGSIIDNPDGSTSIFPIRSEANLVTWHLGMSFGIR
jgi:hypothetical protein